MAATGGRRRIQRGGRLAGCSWASPESEAERRRAGWDGGQREVGPCDQKYSSQVPGQICTVGFNPRDGNCAVTC